MPSQPSPTYIHTLTSSFASTLDEIPQDMCRHFADLRELDAVLSQSLSGITSRIDQLTEKIENGLASIDSRNNADSDGSAQGTSETKEEKVINMFRLLHEIAEDTGRIKLGGEDKIRVASLAAEHMNAYHSHLLTLVRRMYDLDAAYALEILAPNTQYPHVHPSALIDPAPENRRGAPRRTVAVQNNSYGLPIETVGRGGVNGANGDTPTKRRRPANQASLNHHSHLARERENDTDDYSTPRRGAAALDAEAYRPGGNTASRARAQGRKVREVRGTTAQTTMVESTAIAGSESLGRQGGQSAASAMQGVEPTSVGPSHSKSHNQGNRNRVSSSQAAQPPMSQQYPPHYHQQPFVPLPGQMPFGGPSGSYAPLSMIPGGSNTTANMNPIMDAAAYHAMNMNPNLNHGSAVYAHGISVGMGLPASLPPPPGSGHGRPHSASLGGRNAQATGYESGPTPSVTGSGTGRGNVQTANVDPALGNNGHASIKNRSTSGTMDSSNAQGLMPVPMSLPPMTTLTQQPPMGGMSHQPQASNETRPRGYSASTHNQSYTGPTYNSVPDPHRPGSSAYASQGSGNHPSLSPVTSTQTQPGYGSSAGPGSYMDRGATGRNMSQMEAHPSLLSPITPKDPARAPPPRETSGSIHASLDRRDRDPPFRTHSAGSGDREKEREHKSNRPRTNTIGLASAPPKYEEGYPGGAPNVVDRSREGHPGGYNNRGPALFHGSLNPSTTSQPPHANSQSQPPRSAMQRDNQPTKMEERDVMGGAGKNSLNLDRLVDDREREGRGIDREAHSMSRGAPQDEVEQGSALAHDDIKTPIRRRTTNTIVEGALPRDGNFNEGGEVIEGQVIDDDSKPYCICHQPSFGQMIACDDSECEYEWFHLACLGITGTPPQGDFICDACKTRRQKGNRKTGRKKGNGGGGGGGNGRGRGL